MKPPIFVWKSGILDVFDTVAELEQRYLADALAGDDIAFYDSSGRILVVSAESTGSTRIACDNRQPPHPDRLAALLRGYLEHGGISAETFGSLSLSELIQKVYPSSEPSTRSINARKASKFNQTPAQQPDSKQGFDPLFRIRLGDLRGSSRGLYRVVFRGNIL